MAAVIEIQVQADIRQAATGLQTMLTQLTKLGTGSEGQAKVVQSAITKLVTAAKGLDGLDFGTHFEQEAKKISESTEAMQAKAAGVGKLFETFGTNVNLSGLVAAFNNTDKSVEGLEAQIFSLRDAIELTTDPVILQRFGQQLNALTSQLANTRIVGAVKVEKITIPKLDVPLVAPKIDLSALQALQATFNSTIAPVDQLEAKIKGLEVAITKATNPAQPALFRAEIDKLKTQLSGLKFDRIDIDPTSLRVLQSAFIDANKPLTQLEAEIQVLEAALKSATANGSKDVGRLSEQLGILKAKFTTLTDTSLATAFTDATKSVSQLENEIFSLGEKIKLSTNPEEIIQFTAQINNLQKQLNNLKFGGIDLKINSSGLTALQTAFIDAIKPAQQLENEIEALEQALKINVDPAALKVYGVQVEKLKQQLKRAGTTEFQKTIQRTGQEAIKASSSFRPFTKGSNEASFALLNLGRVAQDAPFGFIGIANNLNPLLESFQRLSKESGGLKNAMKALAGSLMGAGGIGLALSAFQFIALGGVDVIAKMFSGVDKAKVRAEKLKKAAEDAKAASEAFIESLDKISQFKLKGAQDADKELISLSTLYNATQNQNIAISDRKKLVDQLQEQYPKYFKNLSDEIILAGGAEAAYKKLSASILASAQARSGEKALEALAEKKRVLDKQAEQAAGVQTQAAEKYGSVAAKNTKEIKIAQKIGETTIALQNGITSAANRYKEARKNTVGIEQQINANLSEQKKIADEIQKIIAANGADAIISPTQGIKDSIDKDKTKYNFFNKFFDFTPPNSEVEKQINDMFETANDYAQKNVDLFQVKVGDKFIDLSELQQVGNRKEVVELGKKVWTSIQEGLVKFKPPKLDLATEVNLVPAVNDTNFTGAIDSFISSMQKSIQGKQEITEFLNIPDRSQVLDTYLTKFQQIGATLPSLIEIEDVMGNLQNVDLNTAKGSELTFNFDSFVKALQKAFAKAKTEVETFKESFQSTVQNMVTNSFVAIGDALGNLVSGSGIGEAFSSLFQFIGGAIQDLGKQMISMSALFLALKKAIGAINPAASLIAGIGLVALGGVIKGIRPKGFAAGGLVFGPTMGLVGEGSGTSRSNPEVIAPLDKLKGFLGGNNGAPSERLVAQVSGQNIDLVLQRFYGKQRRNG